MSPLQFILVYCHTFQTQNIEMYGKYETAKQVVSSYKQISHVLSEQLVSRDKASSDYLRRMRETLLRQHEELVKTQRVSGLPSRLPYCKKTIRNLLSTPKMLRKEPVDESFFLNLC